MQKQGKVFLGGTCGKNHWREGLIQRMTENGVPAELLFNPVTPDWNEEMQRLEDEAKRTARFNLFVLTDPQQEMRSVFSVYSYVQLLADLYDTKKQGSVVAFDTTNMDEHSRKSIKKIERDLKARFGDQVVLRDLQSLADYIVAANRANSIASFFLGGTCGNNQWRQLLLKLLDRRGVSRDRLFDPNVGSLGWNKAVQFLEDQAKAMTSHSVYFIGDPMEERKSWTSISLYSNIETLAGLYDDPERTVIVCDFHSLEGYAREAMEKMYQDIKQKFQDAHVFPGLPELEVWLIAQYR